MARLAVTVSVIFFLFAFAQARLPFTHPENEIIGSEASAFSENENEAVAETEMILLPSEKPEVEDATEVQWKTATNEEEPPLDEANGEKLPEKEVVDEKLPEPESELAGPKLREGSVLADVDAVPLTVISFRPVHRHFHHMHKRHFPFRFPHRCRHHFKPMGPRFIHREISYGNDMLTAGDDAMTTGPVFHGDRPHHHRPAWWMDIAKHMPTEMPTHDFKPAHHHPEGEDMEEKEAAEGEREHGGLFKRFRKFLNHF